MDLTQVTLYFTANVTDEIQSFEVQFGGTTFGNGVFDELRVLASMEFTGTSYVDDEAQIIAAIEDGTLVV